MEARYYTDQVENPKAGNRPFSVIRAILTAFPIGCHEHFLAKKELVWPKDTHAKCRFTEKSA
ncbi:MAG TPA: hypothetical protein DEF45_23820 [Rhodopirellula sp.]|nr:hypothetical protein [Rhodopirellula sp.]